MRSMWTRVVCVCVLVSWVNAQALNCTMGANEEVTCNNGKTYASKSAEMDKKGTERFWLDLGASVALVLMAGMMSGLTMGLMSMSLIDLQLLANAGSSEDRRRAKAIIPLVERHHLLLVTLLLANALCAEALPLSLNRLVSEALAIVISVTAVLFFGEIIPQAVCTRYGLSIGASLVWPVRLLILIFLPVSWPIAKLLDLLLGDDHTTFHRRAELKELVKIYQVHNKLLNDEMLIIQGALDLNRKVAREAMTPLEKVAMLSIHDKLDRETMDAVVAFGHSRLPVYSGSRQNIIGIVLVKNLIALKPEDAVNVATLKLHPVPRVEADMSLVDLLNLMQAKRVHMATVGGDGVVEGVITLEDVFEQLIQEEIYDETDAMNGPEAARAKRMVKMAHAFVDTVKKRSEARKQLMDETKLSPGSTLARTLTHGHPHTSGIVRSGSEGQILRGSSSSGSSKAVLTGAMSEYGALDSVVVGVGGVMVDEEEEEELDFGKVPLLGGKGSKKGGIQ